MIMEGVQYKEILNWIIARIHHNTTKERIEKKSSKLSLFNVDYYRYLGE